ncbi:MAG: EAL domain-containing protein [Gammaproteobacteria bacterium]|nr:EAL domain-containing protein [Gammaproteobacteria bacterium]NND59520.1 EAL domain-containing protein [Gammaproteobacteria bacterium]
MSTQSGIPVVVVTKSEDHVEAVSRALRNAGQPAHCQWVPDTGSLPEVLRTGRARLLCVFVNGDWDRLTQSADQRDRYAADLPLLAIDRDVDETTIARAMVDGANDLVTLEEPVRLSAVALRELRAYRQYLEVRRLTDDNEKLTAQLSDLIDESAAPVVYTTEGVIVNVNPAWLELFGYVDADDLVGTPVLDIFADDSRTAIKGALVACNEGKWSGHEIAVRALGSAGGSLSVTADVTNARHEGEPCVRIEMQPEQVTVETVSTGRHPVTGLFLRERFVNELEGVLDGPAQPGVTLLAYLRLDEMGEARNMLDPIASDRLTLDAAAMLSEAAMPADIYGQFGGDIFMVLITRGTLRDARAWADNLRRTIGSHVFEAGTKSMSLTCTVGIAQLDPHHDDVNSLMHKAQQAYRDGRLAGGDRVVLLEKDGSIDRGTSTVTLEQLKQALMQNGFRLVFQPVASMLGKSREMFDVLIRMRGPDDSEIMPADFLPVARRAGLMKGIDRWVSANALRFCREHKDTQLFVRLSEDTIVDDTFVAWFSKQMHTAGINAGQIVFQVTEQHAEEHLKECKQLATQLQAIDCLFAIEHFGVGHRPLQTLEHVPANLIKVDGSLMQGLAGDKNIQEKVGLYIKTAKSRDIETIAERVEDANTMAVLWQLGVEFIQGYYVQGPEEVVLESVEAQAVT